GGRAKGGPEAGDTTAADLDRLNANLAKVEELSQRLITAVSRRKTADPGLHAPSGEVFMKAATAYMTEMMQNPSKILEQQISYWGKALKHYVEAQHVLTTSGKLVAPQDRTPKDRRFSNPLWESHPFFNYVKQQYLLSAEAMEKAVAELENIEDKDKKRIE